MLYKSCIVQIPSSGKLVLESRIIRITPGEHVRESRAIHIPPVKNHLDHADSIHRGMAAPECRNIEVMSKYRS